MMTQAKANRELALQKIKWEKLYMWLNDFKLTVAVDENTPPNKVEEHQSMSDTIDAVIEEMESLDIFEQKEKEKWI